MNSVVCVSIVLFGSVRCLCRVFGNRLLRVCSCVCIGVVVGIVKLSVM